MSLISNKNFLQDDDVLENDTEYTVTPIVTNNEDSKSLKKFVIFSTALHPAVVGLIYLISFILILLNIDIPLLHRMSLPQPKRDIEFVLVDKPAPPRNPKTKNRADINSRSGGINDPKRKVSMPSPKPQKAKKASSSANNVNNMIKKQQAAQAKKAVTQAKQQAQKAATKPNTKPSASNINKPSPAKPAPPTARPSAKPISSPAPVAKPSNAFGVPAPSGAPLGKTLATGPVGGTSSGTGNAHKAGGSSSGGGTTYAPRPSLAPTGGSRGSGQLGRSSSGGSGNVGNPGGGGGAPGIDALREPDFGPYMRDLQRRIKLNWDPPKGNESKTVVLLFKIAKDGRLLSCSVQRSSGLPSADQAALNAVKATAPFRPLPADFKGQNIDIQFTFDYRVFGASRY